MKKIITLAMVIAITVILLIGSTVFAADPVVEVTAVSPGGGNLNITVTGIDSSTWNPGSVGQVNTFTAVGQYTVDYKSYTGVYGKLNSYVNAESTTGAAFQMTDHQDFDILSANWNYHTVGDFTAYASGTSAQMNVGSIGSMYLWSEANYPYSTPALQGDTIYKNYNMETSGILTATMYVGVTTSGVATMDHSAQWGFGSSAKGSIDGSKSATNTVTATGTGHYQQYVASGTTLTSNANFTADGTPVTVTNTQPGGSFDIISNFTSTFNLSNYTVTAK